MNSYYLYNILDFSNIVITTIKAPNDFIAYDIAKTYYGHYYNVYVARLK